MLFLSALNLLILLAAKNPGALSKGLVPLLGLMFAFLGNYMYNIKPNYLVGVRVPWTLNNDDNWRRTHQLAGRLWFVGGLVLTVISLITPAHMAVMLIVVILVPIALAPVVYSYLLYKRSGTPSK